jgi:CRP-like cAMP-binding protein
MFELIKKNIAKHIHLTDEEFNYFSSLLRKKRLRKKQVLLDEGEVCTFECFVNSGCLRQYFLDEKGQEHIVQFAVMDWWISDQYSFLTGNTTRYFIDALEESEVLLMDKPDLEVLFIKVPKFERFFRIAFQNAFVAMQQRILTTLSESAEKNYLEFMQRYPNIEQTIPQHQVASYLGITPESLSRIRKQMTGK